jgi:hypothetical protein
MGPYHPQPRPYPQSRFRGSPCRRQCRSLCWRTSRSGGCRRTLCRWAGRMCRRAGRWLGHQYLPGRSMVCRSCRSRRHMTVPPLPKSGLEMRGRGSSVAPFCWGFVWMVDERPLMRPPAPVGRRRRVGDHGARGISTARARSARAAHILLGIGPAAGSVHPGGGGRQRHLFKSGWYSQ